MTAHFPFSNSFAKLPAQFFAKIAPTPVSTPRLLRLNEGLARELRLDPQWLATEEGVEVLAGKRVPEGAEPLAAAYAGHQFGNFTPQLGDGRAILLGEVIDTHGTRRDIQLKGSGPTPWSRNGDGRAALGPVLREYLVSEAMHALGIPTTRALAAVATGDWVYRETALPGAVLARVAASHIRVGSFEFFASRGDVQALRALADFAIARHYPEIEGETRYRDFLDAVIARQAKLVARWLNVGFIHGVMNTDNMSISGETIDYGPCAFMDAYDPETVFSSIDRGGRYAFGNQPRIAHWNLARLAEALLSLVNKDREKAVTEANASIGAFGGLFLDAYHGGLREKLGLLTAQDDDPVLANELLILMAANRADFTRTFRGLIDAAGDERKLSQARGEFIDPTAFDGWARKWRARIASEGGDPTSRRETMRLANPRFIPRNHRVEAMIAAALGNDLAPFEELHAVLSHPYDEQPDRTQYADAPVPGGPAYRTFCGT